MTTHELKTWPDPFAAIVSGRKRFEYRRDDRGYAIGDSLRLREWTPGPVPSARQHTLREDESCVGWCAACAENGARGLNPDGTEAAVPLGRYTGRERVALVTYIAAGAYGIPAGFCVMSIEVVTPREAP